MEMAKYINAMRWLSLYALIPLFVSWTAPAYSVNISTQDNLTIALADSGSDIGKPIGIAINGSALQMLAIQGGFSISEVLDNSIAANTVNNPGFENGTSMPSNWTMVTVNGNTPIWDNTIYHSGTRSIKMSILGTTDSISGNPRSDLIAADSDREYTLSVWGRAEGAGGSNSPAVRVVELDSNQAVIRQTALAFGRGDYEWIKKELTFRTAINTCWIYVYANIWNGYGNFWLDDIELKKASNIINNSGFESGTSMPSNWTMVAVNGNTPIWDNTIYHSGTRSIKMSILGTTDSISGNPRSDLIAADSDREYTLSVWGRAEGAGGSNSPAVRVVELDSNQAVIRQTALAFGRGDYEWIKKELTFRTAINTCWIYVYANIWNGYGNFWLDDIELKPIFLASRILNSNALVQNEDGSVTQTAQVNDLSFIFTYTPQDRYIDIKGKIYNLQTGDRSLRLAYNLPINVSGWKWGNGLRSSTVIDSLTCYENIYKIGTARLQNIYPFSSADNGIIGLSFSVSMDNPRIYRTSCDLNRGYLIQYDFGLSSKTFKIGAGYSDFCFSIYKLDEPAWGFRSAAKKYYELYPDYFVKRVGNEGQWLCSSGDVDTVPDINDYGIAFDEAGYLMPFNTSKGIYSFTYTEPWGWWRDFGTKIGVSSSNLECFA
jgi:hypothetical protein